MVQEIERLADIFDRHDFNTAAKRMREVGLELKDQGLPEILEPVSVWQKDPVSGQTFYKHDQFLFFPDNYTVKKNGREITLSPPQNSLLQALVEKPNMAQSHT